MNSQSMLSTYPCTHLPWCRRRRAGRTDACAARTTSCRVLPARRLRPAPRTTQPASRLHTPQRGIGLELEQGFTSQNGSFRRRSSQPISWLGTESHNVEVCWTSCCSTHSDRPHRCCYVVNNFGPRRIFSYFTRGRDMHRNCPFSLWGSGPSSSTWFFGHTRVHNPTGIWICSAVLAQPLVMSNRHTQTSLHLQQ